MTYSPLYADEAGSGGTVSLSGAVVGSKTLQVAAAQTSVTGCIDVSEESYDASGVPMQLNHRTTYVLDGGARTLVGDGNGHVVFQAVALGSHAVSESLPSSWEMMTVTPSGGSAAVSNADHCVSVTFSNRYAGTVSTAQNDDLYIQQVSSSSIIPGSDTQYLLRVTNAGMQTASNVLVTDSLSSGFVFDADHSSWQCSVVNAAVQCAIASLPGGKAVSLTVAFHVDPSLPCSSSVWNAASVWSDLSEQNTSNNYSTLTTTAGCPVSTGGEEHGCIDVFKEVYDPQGQQVSFPVHFSYTLDAGGTARTDADGRAYFPDVTQGEHRVMETAVPGWTSLATQPPDGLVEVQGGVRCATVIFRGQEVQDAGGSSSASPPSIISQNATPIADGTQQGSLPVVLSDWSGYSSAAGNNIVAIPSTILALSTTANGTAYALEVASDRREVQPRDTVTFTVRLRNTSQVTVWQLQVEAAFQSDQITIVDAGGGKPGTNSLHWSIPSLAPGQTLSVIYTARVSSLMRNGQEISNSVVSWAQNVPYSMASVKVRVAGQAPQTGVELLGADQAGDGLGWVLNGILAFTSLVGLSGGGLVARRFLSL